MNALKMKPPKKDIVGYFDGLPQKVFKRSEIDIILSENKEFWRLRSSTTVHQFIEFLLAGTKLQRTKFEFPSRNVIRYSWGEVSVYELVASLAPNSYFTHYTAVYLHELTEQVPNVIYLNYEQSRKYQDADSLTQASIDAAFKRPVRVSNNTASYQDKKICMRNGMYTGKLGVIDLNDSAGSEMPVTNVERTLIDITVRPVYSGGVFEVLKAFKKAKGTASANKLSAILKKMDFVYPYHQAVGFYLERADYKDTAVRLFRKFDIKYDFYLVHQMKEMDYSKDWRLYFPKGF
jgi:predicted transcriptional regulator of viral defense system